MRTFELEIFDDQLLNKEQLIAVLKNTPSHEEIVLGTRGEGPSLHQCGLIKLLEERDVDLSRIKVITPNLYEELPIRRRELPGKFNYWFKVIYTTLFKFCFCYQRAFRKVIIEFVFLGDDSIDNSFCSIGRV